MRNKSRPTFAAYAELPCTDATRATTQRTALKVLGVLRGKVAGMHIFMGISDTDESVLLHAWTFDFALQEHCTAMVKMVDEVANV